MLPIAQALQIKNPKLLEFGSVDFSAAGRLWGESNGCELDGSWGDWPGEAMEGG
jgi:hypothetical protein